MSNVIKQIINGSGDTQTIKMIVRDNERGPQGEQGEPGIAATITAGQAYSVPATQQPSVVNTGTSSNAVFDFYIPKGDKGDQGEKGEDGAVQYIAGPGIRIRNNVISATGGGGGGGGDGVWGEIIGDITDQTDLQQEFSQYAKLTDLPAPQVQSDWSQSDNTKVDYIKNKPTIPAAQVNSDWNAVSGVAQILNKPTIPTVNNATLTIKQNNVTVASFTANSAINASANITSPVITLTTTDPGEGSALAENNFKAVYGGDPLVFDYSTTEVNTGAKWVNGSSIYKKTINFGALPNNTTKRVAHNITNLSYIINIEGTTYNSSTSFFNALPLLYRGSDATFDVELGADLTDIVMVSSADRSMLSSYVTLYYTKSA